MSWLQIVLPLLACLAIFFIPGALLGRLCGARGLVWAGSSAPITVTLASVGAVVVQLFHLRWTLAAFAIWTLVCALLAVAVRYWWLRRTDSGEMLLPRVVRPSRWMLLATCGSLLGAAGIIGYRLTQVFGAPSNISQTYDNVFHLNAIRFILDTGRGSSLGLGSLDTTSSSFYPAAWHDLAALVVQASGTSIPVAVNVTNIAIAAVIWPLAAILLATRISGSRPAVILLAGALSTGFASFPYLMVNWGVLYPNLLALALLPAGLALAVDLLGLGSDGGPRPALALLLLVGTIPGIALAHPSALLALLAFGIPLVLWALFRGLLRSGEGPSHPPGVRPGGASGRPPLWKSRAAMISGTVAYLLVLAVLWIRARPSEAASGWPPSQSVAQAVGQALLNAPQVMNGARIAGEQQSAAATQLGPVPLAVDILVLVGILTLISRRRQLWLLATYAIGCGFYVAVSGLPAGHLRMLITGVWYNDTDRLAALLPIVALPVAAVGGLWLLDGAAILWRSRGYLSRLRIPGLAGGAATAAVFVLVLLTLQSGSVGGIWAAAGAYRMDNSSALLSTDEQTLLGRADRQIPAGAVVVGNPGTGAALVYALADRRSMLSAIGPQGGPAQQTVATSLNKLGADPAVCPAVRTLHSYYVLDFGPKEVLGNQHPFQGLDGLDHAQGFQLLDSVGEAKLYKVTGC